MGRWASSYVEAVHAALEESREGTADRRRCECPACPDRAGSPDRHRRSLVVKSNGWADCFRCGFSLRLPGYEAEEIEEDDAPLEEDDKIPEGFDPLYGPLAARRLERARKYLEEERGLDPAVLEEAGVGATIDGFYCYRVIVPITMPDVEGWSGFSARTWQRRVIPTYRYPRWMRRAEVLFNARALRVHTDTPALVVEGVFDALALWPDGTATLGDISPQQFDLLAAARRPVVFVPDGDAWRKGASHALQLGLRGVRTGALRLAPGVDPDELDRRVLERAARESLRMTEEWYADSQLDG